MHKHENRSFGVTSVGVVAALVFSLWILVPGSGLAGPVRLASLSAGESSTRPARDADQRRLGGVIVGTASFYDYPSSTASGEPYDPDAFTAAVHLSIRNKFGGIRYGAKYQPAYGIAEYGGKRLVLKFNDVGPLRPGRKFDLSRAAMAYFGGLDQGLLVNFKVTRLPIGPTYATGPLQGESPPVVRIEECVDSRDGRQFALILEGGTGPGDRLEETGEASAGSHSLLLSIALQGFDAVMFLAAP